MSVIPVIIILLSFLFGIFVFFKPSSAIELQRRFYEKINWKIEPISMTKEIRNTKLMGLFVLSFCIAISFFYFFLR
jgi:hypothetical protein